MAASALKISKKLPRPYRRQVPYTPIVSPQEFISPAHLDLLRAVYVGGGEGGWGWGGGLGVI